MFGGSRRHRVPPQPLTRETANPNAATAAASAFMRREQSPAASLSSAAAAAALKARPMTPTNVAQVQTRRTHRRSPSVSSATSQDRTARPGLQRSPSVGSMTERSFRSPSPVRSPAPRQYDVPPVPSIPAERRLEAQAARATTGHRKANSLQTQTFQTASQKQRDGSQGSWFGAAAAGDIGNVRTSDAVLRAPMSPSLERAGSVSPSINFSYPRDSVQSPVERERPRSSSITSQPTLVYDANSRRMVPRSEVQPRSIPVRDNVAKLPKKKTTDTSRSGSHLSKGTIGRTQAPALAGLSYTNAPDSVLSRQGAEESGEAANSEYSERMPAQHSSTIRPDEISQPQIYDNNLQPVALTEAPVAAGTRIPSGREAKEAERLEQSEDRPNLLLGPADQNHSTTHSSAVELKSADEPVSEVVSEKARNSVYEKAKPVGNGQAAGIRGYRVHSESPARTARFAPATDQLTVKHEPPPRSFSPRKSAMKFASPTRGFSPSNYSSDGEGLDGSWNAKNESAAARKKRVRVSFDDQNPTVSGESAHQAESDPPAISNPQPKKPWHSIVGRMNRQKSPSSEEDEIMTPRPALPLFGSVREKKSKESEERPLVRPTEQASSSPPPSAPESETTLEEAPPVEDVGGQSSDMAIGSILAQEQAASKNEANISKYREPLPPVVTSMEGDGHFTDSSSDHEGATEAEQIIETPQFEDVPEHVSEHVSENIPETVPEHIPEHVPEPVPEQTPEHVSKHVPDHIPGPPPEHEYIFEATQSDTSAPASDGNLEAAQLPESTAAESEIFSAPKADAVKDIPAISYSPPSPPLRAEEHTWPRKTYVVPGGFPEDSDSLTDESSSFIIPESTKPLTSPERLEISEPLSHSVDVPTAQQPTGLVTDPALDQLPVGDQEDDRPTDGDSIYSDAYEDPTDTEDGGFMSLDAVLSTPVKEKALQQMYKEAAATREKQGDPKQAALLEPVPPLPTFNDPASPSDDWDQAKAYWRSLSVEKRHQLEREAADEHAEEADSETESTPKQKSKKKAANGSAIQTEVIQPGHRVYQIQPGTKWEERGNDSASGGPPRQGATSKNAATGNSNLRKSMRGPEPVKAKAQAHAGHLRKSLRSPEREVQPATNGGLRKSMRPSSPSNEGPRIKARPSSYQAPTSVDPLKNYRRSLSAEGPPPQVPLPGADRKPTMRRRGSDDSESSFTRVRAASNEGLGFRSTMRRSARSQGPASDTVKPGSGRYSLRSLSPTGSAYRNTQPPANSGGNMRQSLRADAGQTSPSRSRFGGFGRSPGKKGKNKNSSGSRFHDSSDEDEPTAGFRSRFVDSSDEEDTPMRGSRGSGMASRSMRSRPSKSAGNASRSSLVPIRSESPDLPDSGDDIFQPKRAQAPDINTAGQPAGTLRRTRSGRGSLASPTSPGAIGTQGVGSPRPNNSRRGSFLSMLRRKDSSAKISRDVSESAARRDTKLERNTEQLAMIRTTSASRLQKRGPSWPLQDDNDESADVFDEEKRRPSTAGGPMAGSGSPRAGLLVRRSTSQGVVPLGGANGQQQQQSAVQQYTMQQSTDSPKKKKKFSSLRKMFKLSD